MIREPKIPMLPMELPQQRIHEVVSLPARPTEFSSFVNYGDMPEGTVSKNPPRNAIYLCQVEWAWSPMHNRLHAYYLHRGRKHWLLWLRYQEEDFGKWEWMPIACVASKAVTERQAAAHLLVEFWRHEAKYLDVDQFHWINEGEYLSIADPHPKCRCRTWQRRWMRPCRRSLPRNATMLV